MAHSSYNRHRGRHFFSNMHSRQVACAVRLMCLLSLNAMIIISQDSGFVNPLSCFLRFLQKLS